MPNCSRTMGSATCATIIASMTLALSQPTQAEVTGNPTSDIPEFGSSATSFNDWGFDFSNSSKQTSITNQTTLTSPSSTGSLAIGSAGATGDMGHKTSTTHSNTTSSASNQRPLLVNAFNGDIANGSVNMAPVPSAAFNFGFAQSAASTGGAAAGFLPPTSTSSCDFNIVDP